MREKETQQNGLLSELAFVTVLQTLRQIHSQKDSVNVSFKSLFKEFRCHTLKI